MRLFVITALTLFVVSCGAGKKPVSARKAPNPHAAIAGQEEGRPMSGVVRERMDAAGYTYALIDTGAAAIWAAGPQSSVKVGDSVFAINPMPMPRFESKTLKRTFDIVYFCSGIVPKGAAATSMAAMSQAHVHGNAGGSSDALSRIKLDLSGISKPAGGSTIAELYAQKNKLTGTGVMVRGKVVKANNNILGKNWIHLRDGSGSEGANDLTITTGSELAFGQTVLVEGVLGADKNIGAGYTFPLIIENAKVTVEK